MGKIKGKLAKILKDILSKDKWSTRGANVAMLKGDSAEVDTKLGEETQCWTIKISDNEEENRTECIQNEVRR